MYGLLRTPDVASALEDGEVTRAHTEVAQEKLLVSL